MSTPEFSVSPITSQEQFDELAGLVAALREFFPDDAVVLDNALSALETNTRSLMALGRFDGEPCSFFIIGLDEEPTLQAIYVPPDLRDHRLGSAMFPLMSAMMSMSEVEQISFKADGRSRRFFERFGARAVPQSPWSTNDASLMTFAAADLKRPEGWFEPHVAKAGA